jgi:hypothetical protein
MIQQALRHAAGTAVSRDSLAVLVDARVEDRVRSEFLEMPGLRLTLDQAQRLWQLRRGECERLLDALVHSGFLARTTAGAFVRAGSGREGA